jgi:hypothetical protein
MRCYSATPNGVSAKQTRHGPWEIRDFESWLIEMAPILERKRQIGLMFPFISSEKRR